MLSRDTSLTLRAMMRPWRCRGVILGIILAAEAAGDMACPDTRAMELYHEAAALDATSDDLAAIVREASRPMDEPALFRACQRLLRALPDHQQQMARRQGDLRSLPPGKASEEDIETESRIRETLAACPPHALQQFRPLPVMRFDPELPSDVVERGISGWVLVEGMLDTRGAVTAAEVTQSSDPALEAAAIGAFRRFIYHPRGVDQSPDGLRVQSLIYTDYFALARARGCDVALPPPPEPPMHRRESFKLWLEALDEPTRDLVLERLGAEALREMLGSPEQSGKPAAGNG